MSDVEHAPDNMTGVGTKRRRPRWPILVGLLLIGWTAVNYSFQNSRHEQTLQSILNKSDDMKVFKINSVRFPFYEALPMSDELSSFGLLPAEYSSFFTVEFKDGHKLSDSCQFQTYDFTVRKASSDKRFFQISGLNVVRMQSCL